jgi:hypothetical protein
VFDLAQQLLYLHLQSLRSVMSPTTASTSCGVAVSPDRLIRRRCRGGSHSRVRRGLFRAFRALLCHSGSQQRIARSEVAETASAPSASPGGELALGKAGPPRGGHGAHVDGEIDFGAKRAGRASRASLRARSMVGKRFFLISSRFAPRPPTKHRNCATGPAENRGERITP